MVIDNDSINKLQETELSILREIDRFCVKHNIHYSLYAGTAIGAIRHQGFIPWDDDIDIAMTREDFDRFCREWIAEEVPGYYLESILNDDLCWTTFAKVRKKGTLFIQEGQPENERHHEIWVDIFPLDKVSIHSHLKDREDRLGRRLILLTRANLQNSKYELKKKTISMIIRLIPRRIRHRMMIKAHNDLLNINKELDSDYEWKSMSTIRGIKRKEWFPAELTEEYINVPFEGESFKIYKDYDTMLKLLYGDYMILPPKEKRINTHRPTKVIF